jgi:hypothetical protein
MFFSPFQIRLQHIFDPFHEFADSARQIAPMCHGHQADAWRARLLRHRRGRRCKPRKMPVWANPTRGTPPFAYSKGRDSPVGSLATSGDLSGSLPSQSRHWNLRPPVLRSKISIGFFCTSGRLEVGCFSAWCSRWIRRESLTHCHRLLPTPGRRWQIRSPEKRSCLPGTGL